MEKELQNKAWACLPKEMRERIKEVRCYFYHPTGYIDPKDPTSYDYFGEIFGTHNLESAAEPEEMLCVERKKVQDMRSYNLDVLRHDPTHKGAILLEQSLKRLFGNKCLPDELKQTLEQTSVQVENKPKFKVGDKVRFKKNHNASFVITSISEDGMLSFWEKDTDGLSRQKFVNPDYVEPYTEPESKRKKPQDLSLSDNQQTENMEEKELNLGELLKDSIGEKFFHPTYGEITLEKIDDNYLKFYIGCGCSLSTPKTISTKTGYVIYYPSEESFRKYPLEGLKAWSEWAAENITECSITFDYGVNGYPDVAPPRAYTFPNEEECKDFLREVDKAMNEIYNRRKEAANG